MKRTGIALLALVSLAVGLYLISPYPALSGIEQGIAHRDADQLSAHTDFPKLRQNLKEQVSARLMKDTLSDAGQDNMLGALGMALASKFIKGMIDAFVTPSGMASLMQGNIEQAGDSGRGTEHDPERSEKLFAHAEHRFDSLNQYSVWVTNEQGGRVRLVLTRSGLTWRLSNIVLPLDDKPRT